MIRVSYFYKIGRPRIVAIVHTQKIAVAHRPLFFDKGDWILHIAFDENISGIRRISIQVVHIPFIDTHHRGIIVDGFAPDTTRAVTRAETRPNPSQAG